MRTLIQTGLPFVLFVFAATAQGADSPAADFLRHRLRLSEGDLEDLRGGDDVCRMLPEPGPREIALMGVIRLNAQPRRWASDWNGLEFLKRTRPDLLGMGRLSLPATAADLAALELDPAVAPDLAKCRPQKCVYNLSREAIHEVEGDVGAGRQPGAQRMREVLAEMAAAYQDQGDASLPILANRKRVVTLADAPALLFARRPGLADLAPAVDARFQGFRGGASCTERDFFFWTREKIWRREVLSLVHAAFDDDTSGTLSRRVLVEKTFYANHYFRSVLAVTGVVEDPAGAYLFYVNRRETDSGPPLNFIERALANRLVKRGLSRHLHTLRDELTRLDTPTSPP